MGTCISEECGHVGDAIGPRRWLGEQAAAGSPRDGELQAWEEHPGNGYDLSGIPYSHGAKITYEIGLSGFFETSCVEKSF